MADWLTVWGVITASSFVFKPVLEDLAKDFANDTAKDYVKKCFGSVFSTLRKEGLQRILGKALRELLQLIQDELLDANVDEQALKEWLNDVKTFTRSSGVQIAIQQAFTESASPVNATLLAE